MHIGTNALEGALENLRRDIDDRDAPLEDLLPQVSRSVVDLFGLTGSGLLMLDADEVLRSAFATDALGWQLEETQEDVGDGPCVQAVILGEVVHTRDVTDDDRWPELAAKLTGSGLGAVLGVPISMGGIPVGALNVFVDGPHDWDDSDIGAMRAYSRIIETVLASALLAERRGELVEQLQQALDNRVEIERAVGILMAQHRVDAVTAFNRLRDQARPRRTKVVEVARELLAGIAADEGG